MRKRQEGITLMELMIVVAIISLIAAFAYPSYMQFVVKAKRGVAKSILMQVADRQQQFFMDNKRYAANLTELGFPANPLVVADDGGFVAAGDAARVYSVSLANTSATTFTAVAAPQLTQASKDACGSLSLTHTGAKGMSGAGPDCW